MTEKATLAVFLKSLMKEAGLKEMGLVQLVNDRVGTTLVSRRSLQNWLRGDIKKPRFWEPFIGIAIGLRLNNEDTNQLLSLAGQPHLVDLWPIADDVGIKLLEQWQQAHRKGQENVPGHRLIPLEIPSPIHNFTGREEKIEAVLTVLQPGKIIALCGPAGIGKTALLAEILNRLIPDNVPPAQFPDGVVYYSFYEKSGARQALEYIISKFTPVSTSEEKLIRDLARKVLAWKKALLVLDGTEACDDLRSILSVRGTCTVLLTSRNKKDASQGLVEIDALSKIEAAALLKKWAGKQANSDQAVDQIGDLVGRLPLAVRLIGNYLFQAKRTATEFLPELEKESLSALDFHQRQRKSIAFLLKKNMEQLTKPARQVLALAGFLAFAPFSVEVMAAAQNTATTQVQAHLDELVIWSLLDRPGPEYMLVHVLAYQFVQKYLADLIDKKTLRRLFGYFQTRIQQRPDKGVEDYTRLDEYLPHMATLIGKGTAVELWESVLDLSRGIEVFLEVRGQWTSRVTVNEARCTAAQNLNDKSEEGRAYERLGTTHFLLGHYDAAGTAFAKALEIATEMNNQSLKALIELNWGNLLMRQNHQAAALVKYHSSLDTYRTLGNREGEARALNGLGNVEISRGNFRQAATWFEQALALFQSLNDPKNDRNEAKVLDNMGLCQRAFGQRSLAQDFHQRALAKLQDIGDVSATLLVTMNLGSVLLEQGILDKAEEHYKNSIQMSRAVGDLDSLSKALINLGITYRQQEKYHLVLSPLKEGLALSLKLKNDARLGGVYNTLGLFYYQRGSLEQANKNYQSALTCFRRIHNLRDEGIALHNLGNVSRDLNELDKAEQYYQEALRVFSKAALEHYQIYPLKGMGQLYVKQGNKEAARTLWQQALAQSKPESREYTNLIDLLNSLDA